MRMPLAALAAAVAFCVPASATDFGGGAVIGVRAGQVLVYDYEPGVRVRAYWLAPWQNRRYFPTTGKIPEYGRHENLNAPRLKIEPAQSFYREWYTSSVFEVPLPYFAQNRRPAAPAEAEPEDPKSFPDARRFDALPPEQNEKP